MNKTELIQNTTAYFKQLFHSEPQHIFLSPGRINIIGEHVDYNDGFVLPAAINKYICFAISEHHGDECTIVAQDLKDTFMCSLEGKILPEDKMWANYMLGVLHQMKEKGLPLKGFRVVFSSNIPMGAGLSSSAALECGFGYALNEMFGLRLTREEIALMGQKAEHTFVGVKCGIMDQFASVFGKKNHAIRLDCTTLEHDYHNADFREYSLLLLDSKVKHTHLTSGYNDRRREVEEGLATLKKHFPEVQTFRNLSEAQVMQVQNELGDTNFRRSLFVVKEIQRVRDAVAALDASDFVKLGQLMYETHDGLSKDYEVSCDEIDFLVDAARNEADIAGARMMGGGFGGCSINLVRKGKEDEVAGRIAKSYREKFGIALEIYKVKIADGTKAYKKSGRFAG